MRQSKTEQVCAALHALSHDAKLYCIKMYEGRMCAFACQERSGQPQSSMCLIQQMMENLLTVQTPVAPPG